MLFPCHVSALEGMLGPLQALLRSGAKSTLSPYYTRPEHVPNTSRQSGMLIGKPVPWQRSLAPVFGTGTPVLGEKPGSPPSPIVGTKLVL